MKNPTIEIELSNTNEYVATIDEADYDLVSPYNWRLRPDGYVSSGHYKDGPHTFKLLHRHIMGLTTGRVPEVDHRAMGKYKGKLSHLGLYNTIEEASQARKNWEQEISKQGELLL